MSTKHIISRFHRASISMHWLMLALFIAVYASIELRVLFEKGTAERDLAKDLHFMLGLAVFILVWLRLALRIKFPAPEIQPPLPKWQLQSANLVYLALYIIMIGMPIMGWLELSAAGKAIPFFGLQLPALIGADKELASLLKEVHELVGIAGYFLIAGHTVAALIHHYFLHDSTMLTMLPAPKSK